MKTIIISSFATIVTLFKPTSSAVIFQADLVLKNAAPADFHYPTTLEQFKERNQKYHTNIVGGKPVNPPFKYGQWMVALMKDDFQFCAGSLFGPNLVVTAAHCSVLGFPLDELRVVAHRFNLNLGSDEEEGIEMKVSKITVHPKFDFYYLDNDIAVWHVTGGEQLESFVNLDDGKHSIAGRECTVIGWGATDEGGPTSDTLQELKVDIVDAAKCKRALGSRITESMLCAGGLDGQDACQGDSGGPLIVHNKGQKNPVLVGVVSWGMGCAREGYPGVYTRVSKHRSWLNEFLPKSSESESESEEGSPVVNEDDETN